MTSLLGRKVQQGQKFLENGARIPVTYVSVTGNTVVSLKTADKDHYSSIQIGMGIRKKSNKPLLSHAKKASLSEAPIFLREIRLSESELENLPSQGDVIKASEVFQPGDVVDVTGKSKGKGFAGGVKRHGFHGGPKTHGQSDRHRAPGSIGQGTTPGRVYKGKRMAGRMGQDQVTVKNLKIMDVMDDQILIEGLVPGVLGSYIIIKKVGEDKKFVPLYREPVAADEAPAEDTSITVEQPVEPVVQETPVESVEAPAEVAPNEEVAATPNEETSTVEPEKPEVEEEPKDANS